MVPPKNDAVPVTGKFLTAEERGICQNISQSGAGLACQRAEACLALDEGLSTAAAAARTALTVGQVSYLRTAFNKKRCMIFPEEMLIETDSRGQSRDKSRQEKAKEAKEKKLKDKKTKKKKGKEKAKAEAKRKKQKREKKKAGSKKTSKGAEKSKKKGGKTKKVKSEKAKSGKK